MASKPNQQTKSFWLAHIEQWQSSGLSQAAYCRQHDLCEQKFSYRKRQFCLIKDNTNTSTGFARIQIDNPTQVPASAVGLSIRFNHGICIEGVTENNLNLVQPLLAILR